MTKYSEKREFERINVNMEVKYFCCNKSHVGTLVNISERGMFISNNELCVPFESRLEVLLPNLDGGLRMPVYLRRIEMSPDSHDGIGVEVINPSDDFYEFVSNLRSSR